MICLTEEFCWVAYKAVQIVCKYQSSACVPTLACWHMPTTASQHRISFQQHVKVGCPNLLGFVQCLLIGAKAVTMLMVHKSWQCQSQGGSGLYLMLMYCLLCQLALPPMLRIGSGRGELPEPFYQLAPRQALNKETLQQHRAVWAGCLDTTPWPQAVG